MRYLSRYMTDKWINEGYTLIIRENRYLLRVALSVMSNTGLRPGVELESLTWSQLTEINDSFGHPSIRLQIRQGQGHDGRARVAGARTEKTRSRCWATLPICGAGSSPTDAATARNGWCSPGRAMAKYPISRPP